MNNKLFIILSIIIVTSLLGVMILLGIYFTGNGEIIDEDIPSDMINAKELVIASKPYVEKYWNNRDYHIGEISMQLDSNYEGEVEIWYKDNEKNKNNVPNLITVNINTKENKIDRIISQERDTKIVPGEIDIENWNIDSTDAIDIATKQIKKSDSNFTFDYIYINGNNNYRDGVEVWNITLFNTITGKAYITKIDVYTGEIYRFELK